MLVFSHALLISCSHVYLLWQSYALTSIGLYDHIFHVHILWNSHTSMCTYFVYHTLLCYHALIIVCSNVNTLLRELFQLPICLNALMLRYFVDDNMFRWSHAPTPTSFNDYMPPCSLNFMLVPFDVLIIICSNIQMLW